MFDQRDTQTGKQVFRTLSVKYDHDKTETWNRKNTEKQGIIFEKQVEEQTTSDSHITFDNYCDYASAATPPKRDQKEVQALSEDEINAFFTALYADNKHYMYQVMFSVMLTTGCRIGEICALTWDNIDFENSRIHICKHFIIDKSGSHIQNGCKTNAGDRWLTMDTGIMDMLREYRAYYDKTAEKYRNKWNYKDNAVFVATKRYGCFLNPSTVRSWLNSFTEENGLPRIHPHMFRHTSVSLQLQAGISIADAAKRAGHTRPDVTLRIYSHTLKKNDLHCCEAVTKAMPKMPKQDVE